MNNKWIERSAVGLALLCAGAVLGMHVSMEILVQHQPVLLTDDWVFGVYDDVERLLYMVAAAGLVSAVGAVALQHLVNTQE